MNFQNEYSASIRQKRIERKKESRSFHRTFSQRISMANNFFTGKKYSPVPKKKTRAKNANPPNGWNSIRNVVRYNKKKKEKTAG